MSSYFEFFTTIIGLILGNQAAFLITAGVFVVLLFVAGLYLLRGFVQVRGRESKAFHKTILLIRVPKERGGDKNTRSESRLDEVREQIGVADILFSSIAGLKPESGLSKWFYGRNDHISFEIVAKDGKISFYVAVPDKFKDFLEQQIHAQYPHAEILTETDYNLFKPHSHIVGAYLRPKLHSALPLNTYRKMDSDPLLAILNPLSKLSEEEGALIQYIVRPAGPNWRRRAFSIIKSVRNGEKIEKISGRGNVNSFISEINKFFDTGNKKKDGSVSEPPKLTQTEEEMLKNMEEKMSHGWLEITTRLIVSANTEEKAALNLQNMLNSFSQYNIYRYGNSFTASLPKKPNSTISSSIYRAPDEKNIMAVDTEEMASFWHLPNPGTETPHINWLSAKKSPPPVNIPREGIILGRCVYRGEETIVRQARGDRRRHLYTIGKSGSGKSVFIQNLAVQDIQNGEGVCVIDPHGDFAEYVLQHVPKERAEDVIYFNPSDTERPVGLNIMEAKTEEQKDFVTQEMISIFYKLVTDPSMIGPMFEHQMRNVMLTLMSDMENPGTIAEIPRMFTDETYVEKWKKKITDPVVLAFWEKEMAKTSDFHKSEMLGYMVSKVGRFIENVMMRNIIGQTHSGFNFREIMDKKKILIVNLAKGLIGEINSNLLGMIIVSKLQMVSMERASLPEEDRHDFYLYIDEFQNFITESIATILSESRKYRLNLIIANQYMNQLVDNKGKNTVRDAVLGNAGTIASFRIGIEDAEILAKEFEPVFSAFDLVNVEQYTAYIKLLIDNTAARPFNMMTYPPMPGNKNLAAAIKELSRLKYGRPRELVEAEIMERAQLSSSRAGDPPLTETTL